MIRVDGYFLYRTGFAIHSLSDVEPSDDYGKWLVRFSNARDALRALFAQSVFAPKTSEDAGYELYKLLDDHLQNPDSDLQIAQKDVDAIKNTLVKFEHILSAELGTIDLYLILQKRGYDTKSLIDNGIALFPPDLPTKVPKAVPDINDATRCIAFKLPTAAGFHLHRANESVLDRYYDAVGEPAKKPKSRNMGDYLRALDDQNAGDEKVRSALRSVKDFHRNPLIHPEHTLETIDEAIALLNSIHTVVVPMLAEIPDPLTTTGGPA